MLRVLELAERVARSQSNVLIVGESGSGKSVLARRIHASGPRAAGPFVEIACANLSEELIESELFGHEKGAFTDAHAERVGRFEQAQGGTVLIDGVTELPPAVQTKLLRVLQERTFERLGGNRTIAADVRFLASCGPDIEARVAAGSFREDLFYRLDVVRLTLPPLRERGDDAVRLARRFLAEMRRPRGPSRLAPQALDFIRGHAWPGNVRELRNTIESALLRAHGPAVRHQDLTRGPETVEPTPADDIEAFFTTAADRSLTLAALEARYIREVLRRTGGNFSAAARLLGIHRKTLLDKRRRYGID
jgi:DNA-binding NtrC family response regulator